MSSAVANTLLDFAKEKKSAQLSSTPPLQPAFTVTNNTYQNPSQITSLVSSLSVGNVSPSGISEKKEQDISQVTPVHKSPTNAEQKQTDATDDGDSPTSKDVEIQNDVISTATFDSKGANNDDVVSDEEHEAAIILANISQNDVTESGMTLGGVETVVSENVSEEPLSKLSSFPLSTTLEHSYCKDESMSNHDGGTDGNTFRSVDNEKREESHDTDTHRQEKVSEVISTSTPVGFTAIRNECILQSLKWKMELNEDDIITHKGLNQHDAGTTATSNQGNGSEPQDVTESATCSKLATQETELEEKELELQTMATPSIDDISKIVLTTAGETGMSLSARFGVEITKQPKISEAINTGSTDIGVTGTHKRGAHEMEESQESFSAASDESSTNVKKKTRKKRKTQPQSSSRYETRSRKGTK